MPMPTGENAARCASREPPNRPWLGLGVLGAYALLANRLAGISGARNLITCAAVLAIGLALIALKAIVH